MLWLMGLRTGLTTHLEQTVILYFGNTGTWLGLGKYVFWVELHTLTTLTKTYTG